MLAKNGIGVENIKQAIKIPAMLMLCALLAVTSTAASEYTLKVFGNANMDKTIDHSDVDYVKGVIDGKEKPTQLSDANQDGKVDDEDVAQIESIMKGDEGYIFVLDALNRTVKVKEPVNRVVAVKLPIAEAIKAMGAEDKLVGVGTDTINQPVLFPDLSRLPSVGGSNLERADLEKIISLKPDVVFGNEFEKLEQINKLEEAGITVVSTECHGDLLNAISAANRLGYVLGTVKGAEEYTGWYSKYLDEISEKVKGLSEDEKPRVFYYWNWGEETGPLGTSGKDCPVSKLIGFVGARDLAAELPGEYIEADPEWVLKQNPSVAIRELMYLESGYDAENSTAAERRLRSFENRSGFADIDAVKKKNDYILAVNILSDNSWIGTVYLAKLIHPELFGDLDPMGIHQEYLTRFQHLDFDVTKQGLFLYPMPDSWQTKRSS